MKKCNKQKFICLGVAYGFNFLISQDSSHVSHLKFQKSWLSREMNTLNILYDIFTSLFDVKRYIVWDMHFLN